MTNPAKPTTAKIVTANYTVLPTDNGKMIESNAADLVISLPQAVKVPGMSIHVVTRHTSVATGCSVKPVTGDTIVAGGITAAASKKLINTQGTERVGDCVTLKSNGGTEWIATSIVGTWAREA